MQIEKFGQGKDEDIILLEKTIKMKLPEDYKDFLRENNGGRPKVRNNYIKFDGIEEKIKLTHFMGVSEGGEVVTSLTKLLGFVS